MVHMINKKVIVSSFPYIQKRSLNPTWDERLIVAEEVDVELFDASDIAPVDLKGQMFQYLPSSDPFHTG